MRIAVVADLHAGWPYMGANRVAAILQQVQALDADLIALLGDYPCHAILTRRPDPDALARQLATLRAPLGVFAVFGNHDWHDDPEAMARRTPPTIWHRAFDSVGLRYLENSRVECTHGGQRFLLAGLGSQRAFANEGRPRSGNDDLPQTLDGADPDLPLLLLAHEPDIFAEVPDGVDLVLSGHTHGGQITFFGFAPVVPSRFGRRFVHGKYVHGDRQLVVSGGLGCSGVPIRFGVPPEITMVAIQ
ncbi:MAG: metallophosphoesterase [Pseudomonadota bacterium]